MASRKQGIPIALHVKRFVNDTGGDAVVEAAILFPIMIMIFACLVVLAIYLPTRAALQRATQYAANVISTEISDTWIFFDESSMSLYWKPTTADLENVYFILFSSSDDIQEKGMKIVTEFEKRCISSKSGKLSVDSNINSYIIYKEVVVTAVREFSHPFGLSFVKFPDTIPVAVTSTAVVINADEFVRNIDLASDFFEYVKKKFKLTKIDDALGGLDEKVAKILGWY